MCHLINAFRAQHGVPALKVGVSLERSATWMSSDMAHHDNFDHTDTHNRSVTTRLKAFGYHGPTNGENIAAGSETAADTFTQWKNSPEHRTNMLRAKFKVMGVARSHDDNSTFGWYWTTDFGGTVGRTIPI